MNNVLESSWIYSMANFRKKDTGLPVNLWIDDAHWYVKGGHGMRLKFQLDYGNKISDNFASMNFEGEIIDKTFNPSVCELNAKDIKQVSNFTRNNAYALENLAEENISLSDFLSAMIKGGEQASLEQIEEQKNAVDSFVESNVIEEE